MDQDTLFILFMLVVGGLAMMFRNWYTNRPKHYLISVQLINGMQFKVIELDPRTKHGSILIAVDGCADIKLIGEFGIEKIDHKRNITVFPLSGGIIKTIVPENPVHQKGLIAAFYKQDFFDLLHDAAIKKARFRFYALLPNGQKLKSHELSFSSKNLLFKPDTGKYN
ncbi:MAG: hypothetical protein KKD74_11475 [Bacteroidetes bacterium]|nr:hypothetical protein [Bacteroidales bacterium]MBU1010747.1 hypothetical protein [Bacteroidota bacterium]